MVNVSKLRMPGSDEVYLLKDQGARDLISALPKPMIFKGSLGVGGTITELPAASASNEGFTYKVITDGTYAGIAAKEGDTFISNGSEWVLIPSGDDAGGTVTNIATGAGLTGGPITTTGTIALDLTYVATAAHAGLVPALPQSTSQFLRSDGSWANAGIEWGEF